MSNGVFLAKQVVDFLGGLHTAYTDAKIISCRCTLRDQKVGEISQGGKSGLVLVNVAIDEPVVEGKE